MPAFTHECLGSHMNTDVPMKGNNFWTVFQQENGRIVLVPYHVK